MINNHSKIVYVIAFAVQVLFAQDVAQALSSVKLSNSCVEDFTNLLEEDGFDMAKFMKELPPAVAKTKAQLKSPFGKPSDGDRTDVGLTVGCIKALPESPAELQALLRDISLKMGLDLAVDLAGNLADNSSIPANVVNESGSSGLVLPICLATGGLAMIIYGIVQDGEVARSVKNREAKAAVDAESRRNIGYGIGTALLAGGLVVYIAF